MLIHSLFDDESVPLGSPKTVADVAAKYRTITPRPYQQEAVESTFKAFAEGAKGVLVRLPTGCHAKGQGVLMFDGTIKNAEDIVVGDRLIGPDSLPRTVLSLSRGVDDFYEIIPVKGKSWKVNGDHVLSLVQTNTSSSPKCPSELSGGKIFNVTVRDYINWNKTQRHIHKLYRAAVEFSNLHELPLDPYLVGILISDGCISHKSVGISKPDPEIRQYVGEVASKYNLHVRESYGTGSCPTFYLAGDGGRNDDGTFSNSNPITNALRSLGLQGTTSHTKFIPLIYKTSNRSQRLELLAGILDGDGCATAGGYDWISASEILAGDVCYLARSLGFSAYMRPTDKRCQNGAGGTYYRVSISGDSTEVPFKIPRRKKEARKQKKSVLRTGFSVVDLQVKEDYYGFTVSGDHLYLLDDFTVTHNCGKTLTGAFIIDRWLQENDNNRAIVLCHERQLIWQFAQELEDYFGEPPRIEMASQQILPKEDPRIVVASRQTLLEKIVDGESASRLYKFDNSKNWLVILDELHRYSFKLKSCRHILEWFEKNENSRRLGLTATPWRTDKVSLQRLTPAIAIDYRLYSLDGTNSAVNDGYAVPYDQKFITVEGVDFKNLKEVAGDFDDKELDELLNTQEQLARLIDPMMDIAGGRKTLIFSPSVDMAKEVARYINAKLRPDTSELIAESLDGSVPDEVRRDAYRRYEQGRFQFLSVCGLCVSEGTLILTDQGEVPIQDVTINMRIWDGVEFVSHDGVICKGRRNVIEYAGLIATESHDVWTAGGWKTLAECKEKGLAISVSGIDGHPVRESDCYYRTDNIHRQSTALGSSVHGVWRGNAPSVLSVSERKVSLQSMLFEKKQSEFISRKLSDWDCVLQKIASHYRRGNASWAFWQVWFRSVLCRLREIIHKTIGGFEFWTSRMQELCEINRNSSVAAVSLQGSQAAMHQSRIRRLSGLWRQGDTNEILNNTGNGSLGYGESWIGQEPNTRQNQQQWSLRAWKHPIRNAFRAGDESKKEATEVYDILNAGPRNRFTANGLIVSNCKEGFNSPSTQVVAIFRPTKSTNLAEQMKGRSCRPLRGVINGLHTAEERRAAIANSQKPVATIVDLVGITGMADCSSTARLMAEGLPDEVVDRANDNMLKKPSSEVCDVQEEVRKARDEIAKEQEEKRLAKVAAERLAQEKANKRAKLKANVKYSAHTVGQGGGGSVVNRSGKSVKLATDAQIRYFKWKKVPVPEGLTFGQATRVIGQLAAGVSLQEVLNTNRLGAKKQQSQQNVTVQEFDFNAAFGALRGDS